MSSVANMSDKIVFKKYKIDKKIGEGSFGIIYEGVDLSNNMPIAIKCEPNNNEKSQLRDEFELYNLMKGFDGVPSIYYFGQENLRSFLIMDLLGPSLEDLFEICDRRFSIKTVAMLGIRMIGLLKAIHEKNMVYRDVKPDNFLIGRSGTLKENQVYIIDFGMAKRYNNEETKEHISFEEHKNIFGTARYMSINAHLGKEQSRRDDLESLGYVLMYFLIGSLPWQGLNAQGTLDKNQKIEQAKNSIGIQKLCEGYPKQFAKYFHYCRRLRFEETPDYEWLLKLFHNVLQDVNETADNKYDWLLLNYTGEWKASLERKKKSNNKMLLLPAPPISPDNQIKDLNNTLQKSPHQIPTFSNNIDSKNMSEAELGKP